MPFIRILNIHDVVLIMAPFLNKSNQTDNSFSPIGKKLDIRKNLLTNESCSCRFDSLDRPLPPHLVNCLGLATMVEQSVSLHSLQSRRPGVDYFQQSLPPLPPHQRSPRRLGHLHRHFIQQRFAPAAGPPCSNWLLNWRCG